MHLINLHAARQDNEMQHHLEYCFEARKTWSHFPTLRSMLRKQANEHETLILVFAPKAPHDQCFGVGAS